MKTKWIEERFEEKSKVAHHAVSLLLELLPVRRTLKETLRLAGGFFFKDANENHRYITPLMPFCIVFPR